MRNFYMLGTMLTAQQLPQGAAAAIGRCSPGSSVQLDRGQRRHAGGAPAVLCLPVGATASIRTTMCIIAGAQG